MLKFKNPERIATLETPFWYYDMDLFRHTVDAVVNSSRKYDIKVHYSIKANTEKRLVEIIKDRGLGIDCVSGNEVKWSIVNGVEPSGIVFAGVGKSDAEIIYAMKVGIGSFNCESLEELEIIEYLAAKEGLRANVSLRINPEVDAKTHKFITTGLEMDKFGIPKRFMQRAVDTLRDCPHLDFKGLHFHIGSQITDVENVFANECRSAKAIIDFFESEGMKVENVDLGGGLGIDYHNPDSHEIPEFDLWFRTLRENMPLRPDQKLHVEPGRSIVGQCVSLISRVILVKEGEKKNFVILDTGMNDLLRPALYGAYHKIENLNGKGRELRLYDIAGPVCESADVLAEDRVLPETRRGDLIAIRSTGAYGSVMSSSYNMRTPAYSVFSD